MFLEMKADGCTPRSCTYGRVLCFRVLGDEGPGLYPLHNRA